MARGAAECKDADGTGDGADAAGGDASCRICFDGPASGSLVRPCLCRGTQACVHEACLLRWRRLQVLQGKAAAAARCEVCGARYASDLAAPGRPLQAVAAELARVLAGTLVSLAVYAASANPAGAVLLLGGLWLLFGAARAAAFAASIVPSLVVLLYTQGLRLSVLGSGQDLRLGLTIFGLPVEGLCRGMLLVSIGAGGPFRKTVLYVTEHTDRGTLAVILNRASAEDVIETSADADRRWVLRVAHRTGGPVVPEGVRAIHTVRGLIGAQPLPDHGALVRSRFPSAPRGVHALRRALEQMRRAQSAQAADGAAGGAGAAAGAQHFAILFRGVSSWGEHQLEGEVRRGAWGWIRPDHVDLCSLLEARGSALDGMWDAMIRSPDLEVFQDP